MSRANEYMNELFGQFIRPTKDESEQILAEVEANQVYTNEDSDKHSSQIAKMPLSTVGLVCGQSLGKWLLRGKTFNVVDHIIGFLVGFERGLAEAGLSGAEIEGIKNTMKKYLRK